MTKCEAKLNMLNKKIADVDAKLVDVLNNYRLTKMDSNKLHSYGEQLDRIKNFCKNNPESINEEKLESLSEIVDSIGSYIDRINLVYKNKENGSDKSNTIKKRVNKVITPENQKESTKKEREGCLNSLLKNNLIPIITAVICTVIITNNINEWKNQTQGGVTDKNYIDWNFNRSKAWLSSLFGSRSIDINDDKEIESIALDIQEELADSGINMSVEEIIEAIRLLNFNEAMPTFDGRNSILRATVNSGKIISTTGSGSIVNKAGKKNYFIPDADFEAMLENVTGGALTSKDFKGAKKVGGYDIYLVLDILVDGLKKEDNIAFNYAKLFNEIVTNSVHNFTILETAPNETMYAILGTYNANRPRIKELTHGLNLGPIYGNGVDKNNRVEIDGTYGNICAEEIDKFVRIVKDGSKYSATQNNIFYGPELDKMLDASKSR